MKNTYQHKLEILIDQANQIILGKPDAIKLAVATLLANGHLLITDKPGVGKTTLANVIAQLFGLNFKRIQFTSDLLPADITGVTIFDQEQHQFSFHQGPLFTQLVLADEINRATPKCQSALLEGMEERQVTVDRQSHKLPSPFFVIATRNPDEQSGTFMLPDSQLDRFMLGISLGYPDRAAEREMLLNPDPRNKLESLDPILDPDLLVQLQGAASEVTTSGPLLDYLQNLLAFSRQDPAFQSGYSPRAGMSLLAVARAWAFLERRDHVLPEDIQTILPYTRHHLSAKDQGTDLSQLLLTHVAVP